MSETVKAVVVGVDTYRWVDENGAIREAQRGEEIQVSQEEFDRGGAALEKAGSKRAKAAAGDQDAEQADETPTGYPRSHDELDKLAEKNDFSFAQHVRTPDEKIKALEQAGIRP